ncbi:MAG: hypothetical protein AAGF73_09820 [Actinomycetota bacterium]
MDRRRALAKLSAAGAAAAAATTITSRPAFAAYDPPNLQLSVTTQGQFFCTANFVVVEPVCAASAIDQNAVVDYLSISISQQVGTPTITNRTPSSATVFTNNLFDTWVLNFPISGFCEYNGNTTPGSVTRSFSFSFDEGSGQWDAQPIA